MTPPAPEPRPAVSELLETLDPEEVEKADAKLKALLEAVELTGSKGSITIQIAVERKSPGKMVVRPRVTAKIPEESANATVLYLGADGRLVESDPAQMQFDFSRDAKVTPMKAEG